MARKKSDSEELFDAADAMAERTVVDRVMQEKKINGQIQELQKKVEDLSSVVMQQQTQLGNAHAVVTEMLHAISKIMECRINEVQYWQAFLQGPPSEEPAGDNAVKQ